jgi:hypothetical protein
VEHIQHGKYRLASGLNWSLLDPFVGKGKQFKLWTAAGQGYGVVVKIDGELFYGRCAPEGNSMLSLGALAARHPELKGKTALVLIELPSGNPDFHNQVIVIGLKEGVPEIDEIVDDDRVPEYRSNFISGKSSVFIAGDGNGVGFVEKTLTLDDLIKGGKPASAKIAVFRTGILIAVALASVVGIGLIAGGIHLYDQYQQEQQKRAEAALAASNTPQALYSQSIVQYLEQPKVSLNGAMNYVRDQLQNFPIIHQGWVLTRLRCEPKSCEFTWRRISASAGVLDDFLETAPEEWKGIRAISQDEVLHTKDIELPTIVLKRETFPKLDEWRNKNLTQWQFLAPSGWKTAFSEPALRGLPIALAGGPEEQQLQFATDKLVGSNFEMKDMPLWFADDDQNSPLKSELIGDAVLDGDILIDIQPKNITFTTKGLIHVQP